MIETTTAQANVAITTGDQRPSVVDVLIAARKLIERKDDWGKGRRCDRPGTRCSSEAIMAASLPNYPLVSRAFHALSEASDILRPIPSWNDDPERTHAEVLAAFDRAIEAERAKVQA